MDPKAIFQVVMDLVPAEVAKGVSAMEAEVASNDDKRTKVVEGASIVLGTVEALATHELAAHPELKAALGGLVDALVAVGRTAQKLAEAAGGPAVEEGAQ